MKVLDPTPERPAVATTPPAPALPELAGARIGILDNGKIRVDRFCDFVEELLRTDYGVAEVIRRRKRNASAPAPAEVMSDLLVCDAVISAVGD
ncbi:MAG: hypothetical protein LC792_01635 [Actinobacteria bacterium]|nr:hypothetical protein [Actinomycetota bacterium]